MAESIKLDLSYHSRGQEEIFESPARYVNAPCGRRYGKTEGAFRKMVKNALKPERLHPDLTRCQQLWVDTTQSNIERYFGVYLEPLLKPIAHLYSWNKQLKILKFRNGSIVHFGSAEKPENLEGFGYDVVWLNEAGHILAGPKGALLWSATILPMTLEGRRGKGAQVYFLGTPKDIQYGPGLFRKMAKRGEDPEDKDVVTFRRSSMDNPYLTAELVKELFEEVPENERGQEIYGYFEDQTGRNMVVPWELTQEALNRAVPLCENYWPYWGLDVARGGADDSALAKRRGLRLLEPVMTRHDLKDGNEVAEWVLVEYEATDDDERPRLIMVDEIGYGSAALDAMRKMGLPVRGVNVSHRPVQEQNYYRKRDELWFRGSKWCETGSLAGDSRLAAELALPAYAYMPGSQKRKVESKDELKKLGHPSPNRADAFLLSLDGGQELRDQGVIRKLAARWRQPEGTWMSG